jgi:hypothetical protein
MIIMNSASQKPNSEQKYVLLSIQCNLSLKLIYVSENTVFYVIINHICEITLLLMTKPHIFPITKIFLLLLK